MNRHEDVAAQVRYAEYLDAVTDRRFRHPSERSGQAHFNVLWFDQHDPDFADEIRGGELDPVLPGRACPGDARRAAWEVGRMKSAAQGHVRGFREIAGPTRDTRTWEAKALECLYALGVLPPDDLAREDYRCAAQVYALLEVAESTRGLPHGPATELTT